MSHEYTSLRYEKSDGIAHITFSRPDKHNALDLAQVQDLEAVTASIAADPEVRCILVDASGLRRVHVGSGLQQGGRARAPVSRSPP